MTNLLYLFSPDQDLVLTSGKTNYMAPVFARKMTGELVLLPIQFADEEYSMPALSAYSQPFLGEMLRLFPLPVSLGTQAEDSSDVRSVVPWGWNPAPRKYLLLLGISDAIPPSVGETERLRNLSHRLQVVKLLPHLQVGERFCGELFYLTTLSDYRTFIEGRGCCLPRAPLSESGKGLNWCKGEFTPSMECWCARVIDREGDVAGEPVYNKMEDSAMEFYSDGAEKVRSAGCSLSHTNAGGAYKGNYLLSNAEIKRRLSAYVPTDALLWIQKELEKELSASSGNEYAGYLGVDTMIYRSGALPTFHTHPYVEINLRMNMGLVSYLIYNCYVQSGALGVFHVSYYPSDGQTLQEHNTMRAGHPLYTEDDRVARGYLPSVPVLKMSRHRVYILVED